VIDKKAIEMMENRAKMGLPLIEESDGVGFKNKASEGEKKKMAMAGRASKFVQQEDLDLSIMEEFNDEHSTSSKDSSESSFDLV